MNTENKAVYQSHIVIHCPEHALHQIVLSSDEPEMVEGASNAVLAELREHGYVAHATMHVSDRPEDDISPRNPGYAQLARFAREMHNAAHSGEPC